MTSQRFCLRWNNHQTNLLSVFDQLLHAETFTDVTLAVEGQYLKAHKMVLSACSPYFQALFVNHPEKHPIVILKDVPFADMKSLLDFMYRGEVSVDQERLTAFLRVAESLRIKGLTEVNDERPMGPAHTPPPPQLHRIHPYLAQRKQQQGMLLSNPLLGSALTMPKRKRGRPRKLSGSSNGAGNDYDDYESRDNLIQGSPELLEVKMGTDMYSNSGNEGSDDNPNRDDADQDSNQEAMDTSESQQSKSASHPAASTSKEPSPRKDQDNSTSDKPSDFSSCPPALVVNIFAEKQSKVKDSEPKSESAPEIAEKAQQSVQEKADLLDYLIREDGSVVCKICGEILSSRTHWYRHKYKIHNPTSASSSPSAIFQCDQCNAFFKSRKGYFGHLASRHSSAHEALPAQVTVKEEAFPEGVKEIIFRNSWEKQRKRDEQLVAEIIDRVKKECEAQGATESRKGYNRRSTVMNTS